MIVGGVWQDFGKAVIDQCWSKGCSVAIDFYVDVLHVDVCTPPPTGVNASADHGKGRIYR